jgi:peptidoglycan hydrolase-like protein with peptidoglycan-binding domain
LIHRIGLWFCVLMTLLGYSIRGVDGSFGANTRRALALWQRDEGVRVSGYLTADQLRALRRQTGE